MIYEQTPYYSPFFFGPFGNSATVLVYEGVWLMIKGSGFEPGQHITLTICEQDYLMDLYEINLFTWNRYLASGVPPELPWQGRRFWFDQVYTPIETRPVDYVVANECGAFEVFTYVPDIDYGLDAEVYKVPVSIKAWDYDARELQATWPVDVVYEDMFWGSWNAWWMIYSYPNGNDR
jgi:hypothetical protein